MTDVQFLAAGAVILLLGIGAGAGMVVWLGTNSIKALGYEPADIDCSLCHRPCTWFNGRAIGHWSSAGFCFCTMQCANRYHEEAVKRSQLISELLSEVTALKERV